jgi:3-methyladenine DNA glycosylase AlkC
MNILNGEVEEKTQKDVICAIQQQDYAAATKSIPAVLDELYANIPDNKRLSYGRVHTIKVLSEYLHNRLVETDAPVYHIASQMFEKGDDYRSKGVALGILSFHGLGDFKAVLLCFQASASSSEWDLRELAQMFFRKLIRKHPDEAREYLLELAKSQDANLRRFVSETLRPVQENRWFYKNPDYPLSILRCMLAESAPYPRTSVGNNLSDLARQLPDLVYDLIKELVASGDKNSYWVAYRACRNLVKQDPIRVMELLHVDEYKYKDRVYKRSDYWRD